jgi:hypothetical protein
MADEQQIATTQANGNSTAIELSRFAHIDESHLRTLYVYGTWDSATAKFQISMDNSTFFDVSGADAITANTVVNVEFRAKYCRINVASGLGSESINALLV